MDKSFVVFCCFGKKNEQLLIRELICPFHRGNNPTL